MGVGGKRHAPATLPLQKRPGTGWAPEAVWTGEENLVSTGIQSQDRQARSESLSWPFYKTEVTVVVVAVVE
jgi:hypothetical protein